MEGLAFVNMAGSALVAGSVAVLASVSTGRDAGGASNAVGKEYASTGGSAMRANTAVVLMSACMDDNATNVLAVAALAFVNMGDCAIDASSVAGRGFVSMDGFAVAVKIATRFESLCNELRIINCVIKIAYGHTFL